MAFTIVHCAIQVGLQAEAFVQNNKAEYFLTDIVKAANLPVPTGINILAKNGPLYLCQHSPDPSDCTVIWSPKPSNVNVSDVANTSSTGTIVPSATSPYDYPTYTENDVGNRGSTLISTSTSSSVSSSSGTPSSVSLRVVTTSKVSRCAQCYSIAKPPS